MNCKVPSGRDFKEPKECGLIFIPNVTFLSQRKANNKENCSLPFLKDTEMWPYHEKMMFAWKDTHTHTHQNSYALMEELGVLFVCLKDKTFSFS